MTTVEWGGTNRGLSLLNELTYVSCVPRTRRIASHLQPLL